MEVLILFALQLQPFYSPYSPKVEAEPVQVKKAISLDTTAPGKEAIKNRQYLVTFVGVSARDVPGAVVHSVEFLSKHYPEKCVVLHFAKNDGYLYWVATLPADATFDQIYAKADYRQEVSRAAIPFELSAKTARRDDDIKGRGPWPVSLPFPEGMVRFHRAEWTQEIAVTNNRDRITPVHRNNIASKWHQSGGMGGVKGYHSDLYKLVPIPPRVFVGNIGVLNSLGYIQQNRGWRREYADGTRFDDVLSNTATGKVFEHRTAEKRNGTWTRKVLFSDHAERPSGYSGLGGQSCSSCHDQAGTGGYAMGLVPGGDTVLSDPFEGLEQ